MPKNVVIVVLMVIVVLETLALIGRTDLPAPAPLAKQIAYSDLIHEVNAGNISNVSVQGSELTGATKDKQRFQTHLLDDQTLIPLLVSANVRVVALPPTPPTDSEVVLGAILQWVPLLMFVGVWGWGLNRISRAISGINATIRMLPGSASDKL